MFIVLDGNSATASVGNELHTAIIIFRAVVVGDTK